MEDGVAALNDKIRLLSKSLERHSSSPQNHNGVVDSNEKESLQKELERTRDKLSVVEEKYDKAKAQIPKLQAKQKRESIEEQINTSVANKDTLISELEKTSLLKEVEKANKRCSKATKELALALSKQDDMESTKDQLTCCLLEKDELLKELDRYKEKENQSSQVTADQMQQKKPMKVEVETRGEAADDKPSSLQVNDTTITSPKTADTPSRKFSKFDSLKNRYLKKVQSPEPIYPSI